jgi:hypothetical protein
LRRGGNADGWTSEQTDDLLTRLLTWPFADP